MKLNNSIKLCIANFSLFWKLFLYKILAFGLSIVSFLPILSKIKEVFMGSGFLNKFNSFFNGSFLAHTSNLFSNLNSLFNSFINGLQYLASNYTIAFIYLLLVVFVIIPFLFKLSDVPTSETVYSYMASLNKNSFSINFTSCLGRSIGYAFTRTILELPFTLLLVFGAFGITNFAVTSVSATMLATMLMFVFVVFVLDLQITLFSGMAPSMVAFNTNSIRGLQKGFKAIRRNFWSVLSSFAVILTISTGVVYLFGLYSMIVLIPLISLINSVFGQVLFFESQGMNYYLSPDKIINPRKLEQADNIKKVKLII